MRIPRIYYSHPIANNTVINLEADTTHYISRVLRLRKQDYIVVFDGRGGEYQAQIIGMAKKGAQLAIIQHNSVEKESPLCITLAQGISRGEKMDYLLQKSVELGVNQFVLLETEFSTVKLTNERAEKRSGHWQKIITSACEQCGRNRVPLLDPIISLTSWLEHIKTAVPSFTMNRFMLDPNAQATLSTVKKTGDSACLLIGPEGGLSQNEMEMATILGFQGIRLGPRILRTETAGVAAVAAIQTLWGDLE